MKKMIATLRGTFNSSLRIMVDTIHKVGDVLDLSTIVQIVPRETNYTSFFKDYVNFCLHNEGSKQYRVESISQTLDGYEIQVSAIKSLPSKMI